MSSALTDPLMLDIDDSEPDNQQKRTGRRKIKIEYIEDKSRRHITFSKRKAGIMKKAYELSTLTGTQVLLLVASETGHVYTFATPKLQPMITQSEGKNLIQQCLNAPDRSESTPPMPISRIAPSYVTPMPSPARMYSEKDEYNSSMNFPASYDGNQIAGDSLYPLYPPGYPNMPQQYPPTMRQSPQLSHPTLLRGQSPQIGHREQSVTPDLFAQANRAQSATPDLFNQPAAHANANPERFNQNASNQ